nr:hypothetical transcript [Hymenolepis microstoma]
MRLAVQNLPKALEDFNALMEGLAGMISSDEGCENPNQTWHLYEEMYRNCFLFIHTLPSGIGDALVTFFRYRHFIRRKLQIPREDTDSSESMSARSAYIVESDTLSDTLSDASESEVV